ncbi:MAG TPA: S-adenosylmethionine:tRNA ribosyltransferase-isomerase, partial [Pseudomonadota bacterium]|nr:S-adenosylmethionine:tRNA ribosyltransferase-isomerase [Pseudomonadota bacterium]
MATAPSYFRSTDFDFELPESLIAQQPAPERDQSRLMLLQKDALS